MGAVVAVAECAFLLRCDPSCMYSDSRRGDVSPGRMRVPDRVIPPQREPACTMTCCRAPKPAPNHYTPHHPQTTETNQNVPSRTGTNITIPRAPKPAPNHDLSTLTTTHHVPQRPSTTQPAITSHNAPHRRAAPGNEVTERTTNRRPTERHERAKRARGREGREEGGSELSFMGLSSVRSSNPRRL